MKKKEYWSFLAGNEWTGNDGALEVWTIVTTGAGNDAKSDCSYSDFHLLVEFACNDNRADATIQNWGNSGIYIFNLYEIQILDTYNGGTTTVDPDSVTVVEQGTPDKKEMSTHICGALYDQKAPRWNKAKEVTSPVTWNQLDIYFAAARFDKTSGEKVRHATISVVLNDLTTNKIHDRVGVRGGTGSKWNTNEKIGLVSATPT